MAYVDRFIFRFNSVSGKAVRIAIADNDYTGAAVERRLGGSPQLRCELSENIHGMSLEIPAECKVDDEFAVLYTSDPTRFAVRLEVDNVVVWRGFVTPELYAAPWVDPPYDVQITATDGLGELKMKEWPAIGSRTLKEILDTVLGATGLALGIRMISAAANDIAAAADLLTGTTVNLDHMAGKSYYDVLDGLLGSLHCTISQRNGVWLLVRETDVTSLTSGGQVSDTSGNTYPVKSFGSSQTHDCWPVGRLTTEIVPAKSVVEVECPNKLAALITDPDMELNLWQTNGSWTGEDGGYYTLDLGEYISQTASVANATRDADPGFRIKVSSRNTTPFDVGIMRLTVMTTGRDPRSGSDKTLYLKEVTTQGRTQMEWVAEESHFNDGLGMPKTLDHQDCKEFVTDIFRLPTGFNPIKTITIRVSSGRNTVCVHSVNIECMSVYDKAVTRLLMDNGARGDESYSPLFADSFAGNKGNFLLSNSPKGVTGALVGTWSSEAIPSVPYGEWLSKDMALSVATPRLRMSGRLFTVTSLPALFYSNKGLSYITEEWSLDLIEDEADISLISLPAAALQTVEVSVIVEDNNGRKGTVSGGEIVSPKTGDSSSGSGYLDWFIAESYEEDGETKYRLKLNPKYVGMYAEGWVSAGGVSDQGGGGGGTGYLRDLLDVNASMSPTQGQALVWDDALGKWTAGDVSVDLTPFERIANRVMTVSSSSNHTQYPTAKAVYDIVNTMLSSAMRFQGVTSTALVDGSTTNPVVVDGASYIATRGDVVVRSDVGLEYLWTGARWQQLGDETSYAKKTVTITGSGYLTGGGNLEAARTIDIAEEIKTKIDNGATAFGYFTDGAANEAIKLRTPRTIWGQSFDGTADVSGSLEVFSTGENWSEGIRIHPAANTWGGIVLCENSNSGSTGTSANTWSIHNNEGTFGIYKNGSTTSAPQYISNVNNTWLVGGGNVGIGTLSPAYKLDVVGDSRTSGKVYIGTSGGYLEVVNVGTTASPVYALKSSLPFFSDSWVSAGGVSPTGSGGGITGYLKDLLDVNGSMIPVDGQALVWDSSLGDNGRWTSKNVSVDLTPFERTVNKVTSISASSTDGQYPSARAVYNSLSGYLPLTGGTVTGLLTISTSGYRNQVFINRTNAGSVLLGFSSQGTHWGSLGVSGQNAPVFEDASGNVRTLWHAGNDGAGSGLDADLLDGHHNGDLYANGLRDFNNGGTPVRRTVGNISYWDGALHYHLATFYMTDAGRPGADGYIMHLGWDNERWDSQLWVANADVSASQAGAHIKVRHHNNGEDSSWGNWHSVAMTDSNVASATKLETARKLWGNDFDGTSDVKGSLEIFSTGGSYNEGIRIHPASNGWSGVVFASSDNTGSSGTSANTWGIHNNEGRLILSKGGTSVTPCLTNIGGNWGIDTYTPAYKLDVVGDVRATGKVYIGSTGAYFEVDSNGYLHTNFPLYSDSWISAGGLSDTGEGGGATYLKNLLDVDDNLVESAGYGLVYDGTQWTSEQIVPASRKINGVTLTSDVSLSLGSLSNVSVTGATNGQQLIYNGSEWIAGTPAGAKFFHGTCSTSSSSNTKVVDCPSFTSSDLVAGTAIAIVMYNRCDTTSAVTINVNGTGANTLLAGFANRKAWSAQELILAVYDGSGEWDMLPTWYYTYYYGGGGSGGGGGTGSTVVVTRRLSSGTRIATITVNGSATDLFAPSVSVTQSQGSTGGTQIASVNSTAIYAPAVTVTQVQTSGVEVARIKVGSANPVSIFAPSGSSGSSGVQTVVGRTGDVTTNQIAAALTDAGYKLTDTVQDLSGYLPLTAGSSKALTNTLYTRGLLPTANASYDLGSLSAAYNNTYTKRVYLADGVYIEYDSTNRCVYVHGAGIATDSFVSAGGVSTTSN